MLGNFIKSKMNLIHDLRNRVNNITRINLQKTDIELIRDQISRLMKDYRRTPIRHQAGTLLYRGRAFSKSSEKPLRIADIALPPISTSTKFQRANRPGDPKFYCSLTPNALPFELRMERGQFIAIGTWQITTEMLTLPLGYSPKSFDKLESWRSLPTWLEHEPDPAQRLLKNFCCDNFTAQIPDDQAHMYKISAAIAEVLLSEKRVSAHEGIPVSAIQYPSVAMYADDDNLAVCPTFVEHHMRLVHIEFWEMLGRAFERDFGMKMLDHADSFGTEGEIEWKGRIDYEHYNQGQVPLDRDAALKMGLRWDDEQGMALTQDGVIVGMALMKPRTHALPTFSQDLDSSK